MYIYLQYIYVYVSVYIYVYIQIHIYMLLFFSEKMKNPSDDIYRAPKFLILDLLSMIS